MRIDEVVYGIDLVLKDPMFGVYHHEVYRGKNEKEFMNRYEGLKSYYLNDSHARIIGYKISKEGINQ